MPRQLILNLISPLLIPGALIGGIYLCLTNLHKLPHIPDEVWQIGPHLCLAFLLLLSLAFNRSRIFYVALLITLLTGIPISVFSETLSNLIIFVLFPVNVILILFYRERGVFTSMGLWRLAFILIQSIGIYTVGYAYPGLIQKMQISPDFTGHWQALQDLLLHSPLKPFISNPLISIALCMNSAMLLTIVYWQRTPTARVIFTATVAVLAGTLAQVENASNALIMASAILMSITILRDSYKMAYRDELTGLPQRRALNDKLLTLGQQFSIAMLDIDHFKKFNDQHGHDVGDQVLQMVAHRLNKVRGSGRVYRYGGEEFAIVFAGKHIHDASYFLEEVRKSIQDYEMVIRQKQRTDAEISGHPGRSRGSYRAATEKVSVTISIGVAQKSRRTDTAEDVLKEADTALYKAKKNGRNQLQESKE